jgi:hypothetical protein
MANTKSSDDFWQSYEDYISYPKNLVYKYATPSILEFYREHLDRASQTLLARSEKDIKVPIRDIDCHGTGNIPP